MFLREEGRCVVCQKLGRLAPRGECDPAHTEHGGMAYKGADSSAIPLCRACHDQFDGKVPLPGVRCNQRAGKPPHAAFAEFYDIDPKREAAVWWKLFEIWRETR